jgi:hypothetical protein
MRLYGLKLNAARLGAVIGGALFLASAVALWFAMASQVDIGAAILPTGGALKVQQVVPGSPADQAGLQPGDIVRSADGVPITQQGQLQESLAQLRPGDTLALGLQRANSSSSAGPLYYADIVTQRQFFDPDGVQFSIVAILALSIVGVAVLVLRPGLSERLGWARLATLLIGALFLVLTIGLFVRIGIIGASGILDFATSGPPVILSIAPGSAADRAGLRAGDTVLSLDGQPTPNFPSVSHIVSRYRPGDTLRYTVQRAGGTDGAASVYTADVTLQSELLTRFGLRGPSQDTVVGLLTMTVAAAVILLRPDLLAARLLLLASAAFAFGLNLLAWRIVTPDGYSFGYFWQGRAYGVLAVLGPAALLHFSLIFPRRNPLLGRLDALGSVTPPPWNARHASVRVRSAARKRGWCHYCSQSVMWQAKALPPPW